MTTNNNTQTLDAKTNYLLGYIKNPKNKSIVRGLGLFIGGRVNGR